MMRRLRSALLAVAMLVAFCAVPATASAAAFNLQESAGCNNGSGGDSTVCKTNTSEDPISGPNGVLRRITTLIAVFAGVTAIIIIVIGGIRYITSGGDANQVSQAKNTVIYAAIGLVVIVAAQFIISFVISRI